MSLTQKATTLSCPRPESPQRPTEAQGPGTPSARDPWTSKNPKAPEPKESQADPAVLEAPSWTTRFWTRTRFPTSAGPQPKAGQISLQRLRFGGSSITAGFLVSVSFSSTTLCAVWILLEQGSVSIFGTIGIMRLLSQ